MNQIDIVLCLVIKVEVVLLLDAVDILDSKCRNTKLLFYSRGNSAFLFIEIKQCFIKELVLLAGNCSNKNMPGFKEI